MAYSISLLTIADFRREYITNFGYMRNRYHLTDDMFEDLYDWLITHAVANVCRYRNKGIVKEYKHDVYTVIYSEMGSLLEVSLRNQLDHFKLNFFKNESIKVLVAGDILVIARANDSIRI